MFKAKFYYAIWFEASSKLVADRFEAAWFEIVYDQLRTSFELVCDHDSVMEFGLYGNASVDVSLHVYGAKRLRGESLIGRSV